MADNLDLLPVLTYDSTTIDGSKGLGDVLFGSGDTARSIRHFDVPVEKVEAQMTSLLKQVGRILSNARQSAGDLAGMELDEVELAVEISGQGEVSLLGIGGQAGASGAITLKFKRKP
jgi:hypothetical protein